MKTDNTDLAGSSMEQHKQEEREIINEIGLNYIRLEESITSQLKMSVKKHHVTSGTFREDIWKGLFEQIIPRKFSIEQSIFIIDSQGRVSKEVDLAIFDEQYTPYIFRHGRIKYIPIEAVAVVIQCKSDNVNGTKNQENLADWSQSISDLKTSLKSISRLYGGMALGEYEYEWDEKNEALKSPDKKKLAQTSTRPIQILCHTNKSISSFIKPFDINISPDKNEKRLKVNISPKFRELPDWYKALNHVDDSRYKNLQGEFEIKNESKDFKKALGIENYRIFHTSEESTEEISLLSLIFQLNQLLMLINNPILFPHMAYVEMFNRSMQKTGVNSKHT